MRATRLATRLRNYDWAAAFIELMIVVVGILIALQVSNWNENRLDRARADSYYRRLHSELLADTQNIDNALKFWGKVSDYGQAAIGSAESNELVDNSQWKTLLAWYQASQLMPFELEDATYSEMRSSGGMALVDDEDLRKRLADYYKLSGTGITANILRHDPAYRVQVRGLTPWHVQQYIWKNCFLQVGGGNATNQVLMDCPTPISETDAAAILDTYRRSDTLIENLRALMSTLSVSTMVLRATRGDTVALAVEVEKARRL